jgi:hypothetical protein
VNPPLRRPVDAAALRLAGEGARIVATTWATVDLDRTLATIAGSGGSAATTERAPAAVVADPLLGARVVLVAAGPGEPPLAVAEPATEGRLAAFLARNGEGPAGGYVAVGDGLEAARERALAEGVAVSPIGGGPFGPAFLVLPEPATGPLLILCDPPAVPSPP